ncbi:MAG: hypothetical protein H6618_08265 [Deltaproteobacteria bacterium]|nr:hypothetical protein [Deltaproteobacteria bacterium]
MSLWLMMSCLIMPEAGGLLARDAGNLLLIHPSDRSFPLHPFRVNGEDRHTLSLLQLSLSAMFIPAVENNLWTCQLCESFPDFRNKQLELLADPDQPYDLKMSLRIKDDLFWGDRHPVTGKDVHFTWQLAKQFPGHFPGKEAYDRIEQVVTDRDDPKKITLFLKGKTYPAADWGFWFILPELLEGPVWREAGGNIPRYMANSHYTKTPFHPGLWSGPYLPKGRNQHGQLFYTPHPLFSFPGSKPFKTIEVIDNPGEASPWKDKSVIVSDMSCLNLKLCDAPPKGMKLVVGESEEYEQLTLNLRNPLLKDIRVRQALRNSVSRDYIFDVIYSNTVAPAWQFLPSSYPGFDREVQLQEYRPPEAARQLTEAGWLLPSGHDIRHKWGKPLEIVLVTSKDPLRIKTAEYLKTLWKKSGIHIRIRAQDRSEFMEQTLRKLSFSGMALFSWKIPLDPPLQSLFSSSSVPTINNHYQGQNLSAWMNHDVDQWIHQLQSEFDLETRKKLLLKLQKRYVQDIPAIPLFFRLNRVLLSDGVKGFVLPENSFPVTLWANLWTYE